MMAPGILEKAREILAARCLCSACEPNLAAKARAFAEALLAGAVAPEGSKGAGVPWRLEQRAGTDEWRRVWNDPSATQEDLERVEQARLDRIVYERVKARELAVGDRVRHRRYDWTGDVTAVDSEEDGTPWCIHVRWTGHSTSSYHSPRSLTLYALVASMSEPTPNPSPIERGHVDSSAITTAPSGGADADVEALTVAAIVAWLRDPSDRRYPNANACAAIAGMIESGKWRP